MNDGSLIGLGRLGVKSFEELGAAGDGTRWIRGISDQEDRDKNP